MSELRWQLRQGVDILGWQGLVGLVLAAAAVGLYFAGIAPNKARISQLQLEAVSVRDFARVNAQAADAVPSQESWLQHFYGLLPVKASAPDWLRIIFSAAHAQSLTLEQGEYKMSVDKNGRLLTYEIGLPVHGSYVQVRKFIAEVLKQIPAASLNEIVIKRDSIGDARIEASIRFTLYLNAG